MNRSRAILSGILLLAAILSLAIPGSALAREIAHGQAPPAEIKEPPIRVLDTSCPDLNGCFWDQASYGGGRFVAGTAYAGTWYGLSSFDRSAKNRFGNRRIQLGQSWEAATTRSSAV